MNFIKSCKRKLVKACKLGFCVSLFAFSALSLNIAYANCHHPSSDDLELGIELETNYWTQVQEHNVKEFSHLIAPIFQGINISGVYTRDQQIAGLAKSTLASFSINNPIAKRDHDVLVFSYDFVAIESNLTNGPSITVWKKIDCSWKIISHTYVPFR